MGPPRSCDMGVCLMSIMSKHNFMSWIKLKFIFFHLGTSHHKTVPGTSDGHDDDNENSNNRRPLVPFTKKPMMKLNPVLMLMRFTDARHFDFKIKF